MRLSVFTVSFSASHFLLIPNMQFSSAVSFLLVFSLANAFYHSGSKKFSIGWARKATPEREWSLSQTIEAPIETTKVVPAVKKVVPAAATAVPPPLVPIPEVIREVFNAKKTARIHRDGDGDDNNEKPILLFLPGLDGIGAYSAPVIAKLNGEYDVYKLAITGDDRSTFLEMATFVTQSMTTLFSDRSVVLVGESFGGLLASYLALRVEPGRISNMVLINPATSFGSTRWETLAPLIANTGRAFPLVGLATLLSTAVDGDQFQRMGRKMMSTINSTDSAVKLLNNMFDSAKEITTLLSPKTLNWRISKWLGEGSFIMENKYAAIKTPTLILTGVNDRLLPSRDEGRRLQKAMTGSSCVELKEYNNGHALLEEGYVDLLQVMMKSDVFLPPDRDVYDVNMPSSEDMEELEKQWGPFWNSISPVFLSRDSQNNGALTRGIKNLPSSSLLNRPVLLVGNHQFFGGDLPLLVREFINERDTLIRGMAHPMIFANQAPGQAQGVAGTGKFYKKFGAVEVGPFSFYEMLKRNETILLFPGGAKEALHAKGEDYMLKWPEKVDFVRMAGIFNCIIVPFAGIGIDDSVNIVLDKEDIKKLPWTRGNNANNNSTRESNIPQARAGIQEDFSPSFFLPKPTGVERVYFLFQEPIDTAGINIYNKTESRILYERVKGQVQNGIDTLKVFRESDPYRGYFARTLYERNSGTDAPTAPLNVDI